MMSDQAKFQQTWSTESTGNLPDESMKIAVCGMAVRLPGGIASPEQLWDVLINKVDTQSSVPATRYDAEHFYSKSGKPGHVRSRRGYFLDDSVDLGALDTTFFNFSRQALEKLDPQVRLLLELVYECFESAGERDYRGKPIGCFVGGNTGEWSEHLGRDPQAYGMHRTTGRGGFSLANRLSYEYDLKGPSMSLETACSSSLVALHQACQAIRGGDCAAALVGGANLIRTPSLTLDLTGDGAISPTASCRTFDASADGYARGEAVNMVYLKNLDDALRDGNPIHAVIRGSATNSDGKTAGFTLPSAVAQESLIREAYRKAGIVDPSQTAFIELHGTGTPTGDPIETAAAGNVFKSGIYIGSIKPNTGHGEGASGITSFIKAVLTLQHAVIPPNIKFQNPNPRIRFEEHRLEVPVVPMSWPENKAKRVSVNSFGIGGSNAHVVLDSADSFFTPATNMQPIRSPSTRSLLLFSANCEESLWRQVTNQQQFLADGSHKQFDLAYTLSLRRNHLPHRAFSVAHRGEISFTSEALRAPENPARTIMVFTGQGSQYVRMGAELAEHNEVFAATLRRLNEVLASLPEPPSWNIWDEIMSPGAQSRVDIPEYSQPLTTATQIALVDTLASLGVHPFAVVGHSSGEIAAAYAAGKLKADEAITVAYYRGIVAGRAKSSGAMAAVDMTRLETESFLVQGSCIACENSPCSVTISGDDDKVESVLEAIRSAKPEVLARRLKVDRAYHSSHMKDVGDTFQSEVSRFKVGQGMSQSCLFFSTTTGRELEAHDPVDGPYWKNNLEQPVLFHTAVRQLAEHSVVASSRDNLAFLEIGPHGVLGGPIRQILAETSVVSSYVSCLNRKDDAMEAFLKAVGHLHLKRIPIDFNTLTNPYSDGQTLSDLPTYPWHHATPLLFETRVTRAYRYRGSKKHELLGLRVAESTEIEPSWRNLLQLEEVSWMRDHLISGQVVFPGVGYIAMAGEAAKQVSGDEYVGFSLASVSFDLPMVLIDGKTTELITSLRRSKLNDGLESSWYDFVISSHNGSSWTKHCTGQVRPQTVRSNHRPLFQTHPRIVEARDWYETLKEVGAVFGFAFQGLTNITCSPTSYEAGANISDTWFDEEVEYDIHPTKLDAVLHLFAIANSNGLGRKTTRLVLPAYIEQLHIFSPAGPGVSANVQADCTPRGTISGHAFAVADDGQVVLRMSGVKLRPLEYNSGTVIEDVHKGAKLIWQPHTDFIDLDLLVHGHHDQERLMTDVGHVTSLYTREMLRRLEGVETSQPHLEKYRRWLMVQPQGETNASLDEAFSKLNGTVYQEILKPMREVLDNIVRVFNGEVQPLEILTQDVLTAVYNYGPLADRSEMVRTFGHTKPNLRILEIGAGTGGTTATFLQNLKSPVEGNPLYSKYTFTDIFAGFFPNAQSRFAEYPNIEFKVLDVSQSPLSQGFTAGSYDLVIASNVLHATESLKQTLSNIRQLLHPEGLLYLEELCCDVKAINLAMGILPGWWLGGEDGRGDEPYVSPERWNTELEQVGFSGLSGIALDCRRPYQLVAHMTARPALRGHVDKNIKVIADRTPENSASKLISALTSSGIAVETEDLYFGQLRPGQDTMVCLDLDTPFFDNIEKETYEAFRILVTAAAENDVGILWVTRSSQVNCTDPRWSQSLGMARTIRNELAFDFATCELDEWETASTWTMVARVFSQFRARRHVGDRLQTDYEYVISGGQVLVGRIYPYHIDKGLQEAHEQPQEQDTAADLRIETYGNPDTLEWVPRLVPNLGEEEVDIETKEVGLNFRDVLVAMGMLDLPVSSLGVEAAGVVLHVGSKVKTLAPGDRVVTMGNNCFSTRLQQHADLVIKIPDSLGFQEAATMPGVYSTVVFALKHIARLEKNQTVLIHSACGGVGLAAIQIAKMQGAEIYATVGSEEKIVFLNQVHEIPRNRIFNSRSTSFASEVMEATSGRGIDVVLNSLSGELLHASWGCVAAFGTMVEIGKRDLIGNGKLKLGPFLQNRSYHGFDLGCMIEAYPKRAGEVLQEVIDLYEKGHIRPIDPIKAFPAHPAEKYFREMRQGQHIGKLVISTESVQSIVSAQVRQALNFKSDASYLLVGGLGGLGRQVATWMVERGARHLIFLSRSAGHGEKDQAFFKELESQGCSTCAIKGSVVRMEDVVRAVAAAGEAQPLRGVFNMSMILRDQSFANISYQDRTEVVDPKTRGTWNLHNACVGLPLDFFILFSSLSGVMGQPGQASYSSANTFLDAFALYRRKLGLPAYSIDIGALNDHGAVATSAKIMQHLIAQNKYMIRVPQLLDCVELAIRECATPGSREGCHQLFLGLHFLRGLDTSGYDRIWGRDARLAIYHNSNDVVEYTVASGSSSNAKLTALVQDALTRPEILTQQSTFETLADYIARQLLSILMRSVGDDAVIDLSQSPSDAGLDSLVAVEVRVWWKKMFRFEINTLDMLASPTFLSLGEYAATGLAAHLRGEE